MFQKRRNPTIIQYLEDKKFEYHLIDIFTQLLSISNAVCFKSKINVFMDLLQVSLVEKTGEVKKRERLVILGMLINIHEASSLASIFKMTGLLSTFSASKIGHTYDKIN